MTFRALTGGGSACAYCGFCLVVAGPRQCCPAGRDYDAITAEVLRLNEKCAALESREVCTVAHEDVETCGYCQRDALTARLAKADRLDRVTFAWMDVSGPDARRLRVTQVDAETVTYPR